MDSVPKHIRSLLAVSGFDSARDVVLTGWFESTAYVYRLLRAEGRFFIVKEPRDDDLKPAMQREIEIADWVASWLKESIPLVAAEKSEGTLLLGPLDRPPQSWRDVLSVLARNPALSRGIGQSLARLHVEAIRASTGPKCLDDRSGFFTRRLHAELQRTAHAHPDLAPMIEAIVREMQDLKQTLVLGGRPGDILLFNGERPLWHGFALAHYGDPSFDVAGLVGALLAAACARVREAEGYVGAARILWDGYLDEVGTDFGHSGMLHGSLEARLTRQLGALMLAIAENPDGWDFAVKDSEWDTLRAVARKLLMRPLGRMEGLFAQIDLACTALAETLEIAQHRTVNPA